MTLCYPGKNDFVEKSVTAEEQWMPKGGGVLKSREERKIELVDVDVEKEQNMLDFIYSLFWSLPSPQHDTYGR